jgi:hypothetical protein
VNALQDRIGRRMLSKWMATGLALFFCLVDAPAQAQLKGENLLLTPPAGFKVGYKGSSNGVNLMEWVPTGETVQNWSEMVTVQIFVRRTDLDPAQFLGRLQQQWITGCKDSKAASILTGKANGYTASMMMLHCPLLAATGKPETTMFRAIKGNDSFYVVQRAVRSVASPDQVEKMKQYLSEVSVCEAGSQQHPCPDVKPLGR